MTQAAQQPLPLQHNSDDVNGGGEDLVFQNLFGFVPAAYKASAPPAARPAVKRGARAKQPLELVGRSVRKLFADGKRYKVCSCCSQLALQHVRTNPIHVLCQPALAVGQ